MPKPIARPKIKRSSPLYQLITRSPNTLIGYFHFSLLFSSLLLCVNVTLIRACVKTFSFPPLADANGREPSPASRPYARRIRGAEAYHRKIPQV